MGKGGRGKGGCGIEYLEFDRRYIIPSTMQNPILCHSLSFSKHSPPSFLPPYLISSPVSCPEINHNTHVYFSGFKRDAVPHMAKIKTKRVPRKERKKGKEKNRTGKGKGRLLWLSPSSERIVVKEV